MRAKRIFLWMFLLAYGAMAWAQKPLIDQQEMFYFDGKQRGQRFDKSLDLSAPGTLIVKADWKGSAKQLSLILNGPQQTSFYARENGGSGLTLRFVVTPELLRRGKRWRIRLANFASGTQAEGVISIRYVKSKGAAVGDPGVIQLNPDLERQSGSPKVQARPNVAMPLKGNEPVITVMPDGTLRKTYPDGSYYEITPKGSEYFYDAKTDSKRLLIGMQVPHADPPARLQGSSENELNRWLEWLGAALLQEIRAELGKESVYQSYLQSEADKGLYQKINWRYDFLARLRKAKANSNKP